MVMSGTAAPADDSSSSSPASPPPITPALAAQLPKLNPEIAQKVRDVVNRKT
jgi:hypothetical protein